MVLAGEQWGRQKLAGTPHIVIPWSVSNLIAHWPLTSIQLKLADIQSEIGIGLQSVLRVGRMLDEGGYCT